jgi:hypothetical protein
MNLLLVLGSLPLVGPVPGGDEPRFTQEVTAVRSGGAVKIDFAVSRETDVTVWIEDGQGKILRHLVSGVLGNNPPAPLRPGLSQSLEWDGRADYGKPAGPGPFTVRVALGMKPSYEREVASDRMSLTRICAVAAGPDGTVYVVQRAGTMGPNWKATRVVAVRRDGTYRRTVYPLPAGLSRDQWMKLGAVPVTVGGKEVPIVLDLQTRRLTAWEFAGGSNNLGEIGPDLAVTSDGYALSLQEGGSLGMLALDPALQRVPLAGPKLLPRGATASFQTAKRSFVAASGDSKHAYFTGIAPRRAYSGSPARMYPCVFRVKLPERSPAEPFFGDPDQAGDGDARLADEVGGLAVDGQGHLLIADRGNNRIVVVSEAGGKFVGSVPVRAPVKVAADRKTGAFYVLRHVLRPDAELVKFSGWKDPRPIAALALKGEDRSPTWDLAVDGSAAPPVVWLTDNARLLRVEDSGDAFGAPVRVSTNSMGDGSFVDITVDRYRDPAEVYYRVRFYDWARINEETGARETISLSIPSNGGSCLEVGPDGFLFTAAWPCYLLKWDRSGRRVPWEIPFAKPPGSERNEVLARKGPVENALFARVAMVYMTHTHGIRHDGRHFIFEGAGRVAKALNPVDPSGKRLGDPVVWNASDAVLGPRFDAQGNIYVADVVRPLDQLVPPELAPLVRPPKLGETVGGVAGQAVRMYSSILKFSPKGGAIEWPGASGVDRGLMEPKPYAGEKKLDPSLKSVDLATCNAHQRFIPARVTGAEWIHFGISHLELTQCNCESTQFDVDAYGRVWYPDGGRYRVGVLDTNGNVITHFGTYGNADDEGFHFVWLVGVGASDRYAYIGDSMNQRLVRAKILYSAEGSCLLP